jgi:hypothetical protein
VMYKTASAGGGSSAGPQPGADGAGPSADGAGSKAKENVVDAEFVDVDDKHEKK